MIKLKLIRLAPRGEFTLMIGRKQGLYRALVLCMLPEEGLYTASEVAATAWNPNTDREEYRSQRQKLYGLAHKHGLAQTPDNLDGHGELLPGKRGHKQRARWSAASWRALLSDEIYQEAVDFFEELQRIDAANRAQGKKCDYFYDEERGLIQKESAEPEAERIRPGATQKKNPYFRRAFLGGAALLSSIFLVTDGINRRGSMGPEKRTPEPPETTLAAQRPNGPQNLTEFLLENPVSYPMKPIRPSTVLHLNWNGQKQP